MRYFLLLLVAALAVPAPASGRPTLVERQAEVVANDLAGFGRWLSRLDAIHQPVQESLSGFRGHWQQLQSAGYRAGAPQFRAAVAQSLTVIERAQAEVDALDTPEFDSLELAEEVQPAAMRRDLTRVYRELRIAIESFPPVADALAEGDATAAMTAVRRLFESLRIVLETQVLLRRAALSATPREEPAWEVTNVEYLYTRTAARLLEGLQQGLEGRSDPRLSADLLALAGEFDATATRGSEKLEAQLAEFAELAATLESGSDRASYDMARRSQRVLAALRPAFPIARRLAGLLRTTAGSPAIPPERINGMFVALQPIRRELDEVARSESAALAAPVE